MATSSAVNYEDEFFGARLLGFNLFKASSCSSSYIFQKSGLENVADGSILQVA